MRYGRLKLLDYADGEIDDAPPTVGLRALNDNRSIDIAIRQRVDGICNSCDGLLSVSLGIRDGPALGDDDIV